MEDNKNSIEFTEAENKIRRRWLFWSVILPVFIPVSIVIFVIIGLLVAQDFIAILPMIGLLFLFCLSYIPYHCAYKKPGIILLLLEMIAMPIVLLIDISKSLLIMAYLTSTQTPVTFSSVIFLLILPIKIVYEVVVFYYSYKLRKINKGMQIKRLKASPVYINAISIFETATSLEELNEQFAKLRISCCSGSDGKILAKAYAQQKKILAVTNNR